MMLGSITPIGAYGTSRDNRHIRSRLNIEVIIDQIRESAVRNQRWNKDLFFLRFPGHMNVNSRFILFGCDLEVPAARSLPAAWTLHCLPYLLLLHQFISRGQKI